MTCNPGLSRPVEWECSAPSVEPATQAPAVFALPCDLCVRARKLRVGKNVARLENKGRVKDLQKFLKASPEV